MTRRRDNEHLFETHTEVVELAVLGLEGEDHTLLDFLGMIERPDPRDDRLVVLGESESVTPQVCGSLVFFLVTPDLLGRWPDMCALAPS